MSWLTIELTVSGAALKVCEETRCARSGRNDFRRAMSYYKLLFIAIAGAILVLLTLLLMFCSRVFHILKIHTSHQPFHAPFLFELYALLA